MLRIGLIGFGAIGRSVCELWHALPSGSSRLTGACVRPLQALQARAALPPHTVICESVDQLLALEPNCIIEAAGHGVVRSHGAAILRQRCSIYLLSVGALADSELRTMLTEAARENGSHILIPSGALAGFDGLLTLACDSLRKVKYTATKPSLAWEGSVASRMHALESLTERTVIFSGNAGEAALLFPKNANLAASVALAGIGFEKTQVELVADPHANSNTGILEAVSDTTTITLKVASNPSNNPKTSSNVGASVIAALRNRAGVLQFL